MTRARSTALYARLIRYPTLHQFLRYAMVGTLNVILFFGIFNLLLWVGWHPLAANAVAFLVTSVNSFLLNKLWAFKDRRREAMVRQYLIFVFFTCVGLAINSGMLALFLIPLRRYGVLGKNIAALCAIPFSVAWNFFSYRRWIFRTRESRASSRSPGSSERSHEE